MVKTVTMEGVQSSEPPSAYGMVKTCTKVAIIKTVLGGVYHDLYMKAASALEPDLPEIALLIPVLSFNTAERGKVTFYQSLTMGKLDESETEDLISWGHKLPEDGGHLYRQVATLMKWI